MKHRSYKLSISLIIFFLCGVPAIQASTPVWEFTPLTSTKRSVSKTETATVSYLLTNHSARQHTLTMQAISGVTQITGPELCGSPVVLSPKASCKLSLQINGSELNKPITDGPILCQAGSTLQCYKPKASDVLRITPKVNKQYTVGGTVNGLSNTVVLLNNGVDPLTIQANGAFTFSTSLETGNTYSVTIGTQPSNQICSVSNGSGTILNNNITDVTVNCTDTTTLSVSATGTIPVFLAGTPSSITVTNTGVNTALNVHASLPVEWIDIVNQDVSECITLNPMQSCNLYFSSPLAFVAQGSIPVTGDNISNQPSIALAFTVQNFLVWDVTGSTAQVIDQVDLPSQIWGDSFEAIGITAQSFTQGFNNTLAINAIGSGPTYAARDCFDSTAGSAQAGTWYLPALCQMGEGTNCPSGFANINTNLVLLGFGGFANTDYWSSTEDSDNPQQTAWKQTFGINNSQSASSKALILSIRCARSLTFP